MRRFSALTGSSDLLAAANDIGTGRFDRRDAGDRAGDIVSDPERKRGAMAMRLAPGVGDDPSALAALRQAILDAITFRGGNDIGVSFGGASRLQEDES